MGVFSKARTKQIPAMLTEVCCLYGGRRERTKDTVELVYVDGESEVLKHALVKHSPSGFAWGYGGSGPADLALNLVYALTGDQDFSWRCHQDIKWEFIAPLQWTEDCTFDAKPLVARIEELWEAQQRRLAELTVTAGED